MRQIYILFFYFKFVPILYCASLLLLSGCTHTAPSHSNDIPKGNWKYEFIHYHDSLPNDHPESAQQTLGISEKMLADVQTQFGHLGKEDAIYAVANWLISEEGIGLKYNVDATLKPIEAYQQRLGNCLSYSLLLTQLGKALGTTVYVNSVDIPETWSQKDDTLFFYRHVNVVYKTPSQKHVFDFTPGAYDTRYPQAALNEVEALSLFFNNRALDHYRDDNFDRAIHFIKLAISLNPDNPDIWTNAAAILKHKETRFQAEEALLFALLLDPEHVVAASQLERLYRQDGDLENAEKYLALATKARNNNPYYLFRKAKKRFLTQDYSEAEQLVKKAIKKHRYDPRFFALRGIIENKLESYRAAQRSFRKASALELNLKQKQQYDSKAMLLGEIAKSSRKRYDSSKYELEIKAL